MSETPLIELVYQDLDGCLNPVDGEDFPPGHIGKLTPKQIDMFKRIDKAIENSTVKHVIINTGRGISDTLYLAAQFTSPKVRYLLLEHSALAYDRHEEEQIDLGSLAADVGLQKLSNRYGEMKEISDLINWYQEKGQRKLETHFNDELPALDKVANLSVTVPLDYTAEEVLEVLKRLILNDFGPSEVFQYCFTPRFVDVVGHVHKHDGALLFCRYLDIDKQNVAAIGDGMNDMTMFETFDHCICPQNAHHHLKALCKRRDGQVSEFHFGEATLNFYEMQIPENSSST